MDDRDARWDATRDAAAAGFRQFRLQRQSDGEEKIAEEHSWTMASTGQCGGGGMSHQISTEVGHI